MGGRTKVLRLGTAAISCIFLLAGCSAQEEPTEPTASQSIAPSPTPSAPTALETFAELRDSAAEIYAERDFKGMKDVYDPKGPTWGRVLTDLKVMRRAGVTFKNLDRTLDAKVVSATDGRIVVRESIVSDGQFFNSKGEDVTGDRQKERQVLRWVLRKNGTRFFIYDSTILDARPIGRN